MTQPHKSQDDEIMSIYLKEINKIPLLTREQEQAIVSRAVEGDTEAQSTLIRSHLRFVVSTVKKYRHHGLPLEDLVNEGNIGLMNAISHFDPSRGYHFISYAVWWIRQAIFKAIYEKSRMIRLPLNRANELTQIEKARKNLQIQLGQEPTDEQISTETGIKIQDVKDLQAISREIISLETPMFDETDSSTLKDHIEDTDSTGPLQQALNGALIDDIDTVLDTLSSKEANIIRLRFGLKGKKPRTLKEVGSIYNLTKERIRQIEQKALKRLRHPSRIQYLKDYLAA